MPIQRNQVESHLDKVLSSSEFARAARMARFLRFVVNATLESRGGELKERTIGIEVFDRPLDWDPKADTIVRSEARRLRHKLEIYYSSAGSDEPLRIRIPKGGYSPEFEVLDQQSLPAVLEPDPPFQSLGVAPQKNRTWLLWCLIAALVLIGTLYLRLRKPEPIRSPAAAFEVVPFATAFGQEFSPTVSPDGKRIAYVWDGDGNNLDIYVKTLASGFRERFTSSPFSELHPAWSPDGSSIAFLRVNADKIEVLIKQVNGGAERVVFQIRSQYGIWTGDSSPLIGNPGPAWTPDGKSLVLSVVSGRSSYLQAIPVDGGEVCSLTANVGEIRDFYPRVSPDGKTLAFVRYYSHGLGEVFTIPITGGLPKQLTFDNRTIRGLSWTPSGKSLVFASNRQGSFRLWRISRDGGTPVSILSDTAAASEPVIAPAGEWLAYVAISENWNIWRARLTNGKFLNSSRFLASSGRNHTPRYSPDGSKIAFVSDRSGTWEIWMSDDNGTTLRQLTHFRGPWLGGLSWSRDSKRLAFDARPNGHSGVYLIDVTGGDPKPLDQNRFEERMPSWSPNGKSIYFNSDRDGEVSIWRRSFQDGSLQRVSPRNAFATGVSADGRFLYFNLEGGDIWRAHPDGTGAMRLQGIVSSPNIFWALSTGGLFYADQGSAPTARLLYFHNGTISMAGQTQARLVTATPSISVSPDEKWILFAQQDNATSDIYIRREASPEMQ